MICSRQLERWTPPAQLDAAARNAPFIDPMGLAVDPRGNTVYVTDHTASRAPGGGSLFGIWHPKNDAQGFVLRMPAG